MSLLQRELHKILAGIGVGHGKSGSWRTNYVILRALYRIPYIEIMQRHRAVSLVQYGFLVTLRVPVETGMNKFLHLAFISFRGEGHSAI